MQMPNPSNRDREGALHQYLDALEDGDLETLDNVLAAAETDSELDRQIVGVNNALYAETALQPAAEQAQLVRQLILQHLPSGVPQEEADEPPITVGDVVARIAGDRAARQQLSPDERSVLRRLVDSRLVVPFPLTMRALNEIGSSLKGVQADTTSAFWEVFRQAAIVLGISHQERSAQLAAARRQGRAPGTTRQRPRQPRTRPDSGEQAPPPTPGPERAQ